MKKLVKLSIAALSTFAIASVALCLASVSYLQTNYLEITSQSTTALCVETEFFQSVSVAPNQSEKVKFRVKGDGSFSLSHCGSKTLKFGIGYFTTNLPSCHIVTFVDETQITYKTVPVRNC